MDPISIATTAGSLALVIYKTSAYIDSFLENAQNVDAELRDLAGGVHSLLAILNSMRDILQTPATRAAITGAKDMNTLLSAVYTSINDCMSTAEEVAEIFESVRNEKGESRKLIAKAFRNFKLDSKQVSIGKLNNRIMTHKTNMQLALQTINVIVATSTPERTVDALAPKMDELSRMVKEIHLERLDRDNSFDQLMIQHTELLRSSAQGLVDRPNEWMRISAPNATPGHPTNAVKVAPSPAPGLPPAYTDPMEVNELDSDEELEADISIEVLLEACKICDQNKFAEAEPTLRNALQEALRKKLGPSHREVVKEAQLRLGIATVHLGEFNEAEQILQGIAALPPNSENDTLLALTAHYYLAQISLAMHDFPAAIIDCQKAVKGRKKALGKGHPAHTQALLLLVLIYNTSRDQVSANAYRKQIPAEIQSVRDGIAVLKYSVEGMNISHQQEVEARTLLASEGPVAKKGILDPTHGKSLEWAAHNNHLNVVKVLLSDGAPIDYDKGSGAPLLHAAGRGHAEVVEYLIAQGANVLPFSPSMENPLINAAWKDYARICQMLLDAGAKIDALPDNEWDIVGGTASRGSINALRVILDHGASARVQQKSDGFSALMKAADNGRADCALALLNAGADPNLEDKYGRKALTLAIVSKNEQTVQHLIAHGVSVTGPKVDGVLTSQPLHTAAFQGQVKIAQMLLEAGAPLDAPSKDGSTALYRASGQQGNNAVLKFLLERGADPKRGRPTSKRSEREPTALYRTIDQSNAEGALLLIEAGVDVNEPSYTNTSPLYLARARGLNDVVQALESRGAVDRS